MSAKLIFVLATAYLLVQCSFGKAVPNSKNSQLSEQLLEVNTENYLFVTEPNEELNKLQHFIKIEVIRFHKAILGLSKKVTENFLSLLSPEFLDGEKIRITVEAHSVFIEQVESFLAKEDEEILESYNEDEVQVLLENEEIFFDRDFEDLFKINLYPNLVETVVAVVKYAQQLSLDVKTYWDALSTQDKEEQKDFGLWLHKFSEQINPIIKLGMLVDVAESFNENGTFSFAVEDEEKEELLNKFIYTQLNKISAILFEFFTEGFAYVIEDLQAIEDEAAADQIGSVSKFISDLKAVNPDFFERVLFLLSNADFLEEQKGELVTSLLKHQPYVKTYLGSKILPFMEEFIKEANNFLLTNNQIDSESQLKLQKLRTFLEKLEKDKKKESDSNN